MATSIVTSSFKYWSGVETLMPRSSSTVEWSIYASKGESRSRDAQKLLTALLHDASEQVTDERPSLPRMLQSAMMRCTTRGDMGAQEVQHLNFQAESVDHNISFARASTQKDSVEKATRARWEG